jgi:hypothetical protein
MYMSSEAKGQFIPDLLLLESYAPDLRELEQLLRFTQKSLDAGRPLRHGFDSESLIAAASFVHEVVHCLQFTSRVQGVDYYSASTQLSLASMHCLKQLVRLSREQGTPLGLPLDGFASWCAKEGLKCEPIETWFETFLVLQTIMSMGLLTAQPTVDGQRLQALRRAEDKKLFPVLEFKDADGHITKKALTPWMVLETEAFLTELQFVELLFPEQALQILGELHGEVSEDTLLAVNLRKNGLDKLAPILADFAMQVGYHALSAGGDFEEHAMTWRFHSALQVCDRYAGITYDEVSSKREEILEYLSAKVGGPDIHDEIDGKIRALRNGEVDYIRGPLGKILTNNLETRRQHPKWFAVPVFWLDGIVGNTCIPRVLANHWGLGENRPILEVGMGSSPLTNEERLGLFLDCNQRSAGKQIAVQEGSFICPECAILFRLCPRTPDADHGNCTGICSFSRMLREEVGLDTTTMSFIP